jgi:hypothetical protein
MLKMGLVPVLTVAVGRRRPDDIAGPSPAAGGENPLAGSEHAAVDGPVLARRSPAPSAHVANRCMPPAVALVPRMPSGRARLATGLRCE